MADRLPKVLSFSPMDMQLCTFDWDGITLVQQPQVLREYIDSLCDLFVNFPLSMLRASVLMSFRSLTDKARLPQPQPPSMFNYEGREYYLHSSLNLRRSDNPNLLSTPSDRYMDGSVEITSESIVDLQSSQRIELCQVSFSFAHSMWAQLFSGEN